MRRPANLLRRSLGIAAAVVLTAYPVLVWLGLQQGSPRTIALLLVALVGPAACLRLRRSGKAHIRGLAMLPLITVAALAITAVLDRADAMLAVPVAINALLLAAFGSTLRRSAMPMIERFARLQEPDLNPAQQAWCRSWTVIWCVFFLANGSTALAFALWAPLPWWALYNGLIAYGLIGLLFATEWILRRMRFGKMHADRGDA